MLAIILLFSKKIKLYEHEKTVYTCLYAIAFLRNG